MQRRIRFAEMQPPPSQKRRINYKLGSIYAVVTALLLSVQEPFSFLAAKRLSLTQFVFLTQVALVMSIPLLDCAAEKVAATWFCCCGNAANYGKFGALFLIGMTGLLLFKLGLSNAHPIIISAIINLQPFFAALGGAAHSASADPGLARDLLRLPRQRVSRRDGGRLEPGRRGQPAGVEPIG